MITEEEASQVCQRLSHLGFTPIQSRNAVSVLSAPSALSRNLLDSLSPLDASIEYLVLHLPECDLPQRFLPSTNSSNPFITSSHPGSENHKTRWIEEKAIKEAGWPPHIVKECTRDTRLAESWDLLVMVLGQRLIGKDWNLIFDGNPSAGLTETYFIIPDEVDALGAHYTDQAHLVMPLFSAPVQLHILISPNQSYSNSNPPPMYITSNEVAAYVRLHLLSRLLQAVTKDGFVEPGEGFCMASMRFLEEEWAKVEDDGPPDISVVLQHLVPRCPIPERPQAVVVTENITPHKLRDRRKGAPRRDDRTNSQVKADFRAICLDDGYATLLSARQKLPAFSARGEFLKMLEKSNVVVVVGETG